MRIDSHQHFWVYRPEEYPWINRIPSSTTGVDKSSSLQNGDCNLDRDFLPRNLQPLLTAAGIDGCIAVQARQTLQENEFLLTLAEQNDFIQGVVGWIDLRSEEAQEQALRFASHPKSVGVRHIVQDEAQSMFMAGEAFRRGIACLGEFELAYDILVFEHQLADAIALVATFPDLQFVLDHIAKPKIKLGQLEPWRTFMKKLATFENVVVKISGVATEADHQNWSVKQLDPYWQSVLETFTPHRILFGSDWPVLRMACSYEQWISVVSRWLEPLSSTEQAAIWGENASRIYFPGQIKRHQ